MINRFFVVFFFFFFFFRFRDSSVTGSLRKKLGPTMIRSYFTMIK